MGLKPGDREARWASRVEVEAKDFGDRIEVSFDQAPLDSPRRVVFFTREEAEELAKEIFGELKRTAS